MRSAVPPPLLQAVRRPLKRAVHDLGAYRSVVRGKRGLEIGGPTIYFDDRGVLPVYDELVTVDNCQFSPSTIWTGDVHERFRYHSRKSPGRQFIYDGTDLTLIESATYECFLASHCLEHIANPLRALAEWRRILTADGVGLILLPHHEVTFDWQRAVTPLEHMIADCERGAGEDDPTHFEEILSLHDLSKTPEYEGLEAFRVRCLANHVYRAMHHHVFDTQSAIELMDYAGFQILQVDAIRPAHIVILMQKSQLADNTHFLVPEAGWRSRSVFTSDRVVRSASRAGTP